MANTSPTLLKDERRRYVMLVISGVLFAFLIALSANLVFSVLSGTELLMPWSMYWMLILIIIVVALLSLFLFLYAVSPRRIDREFLMLLVYDVNKGGFPLHFDYQPFFLAEQFRSSVQSDESIQSVLGNIPRVIADDTTSQVHVLEVERLLLQLSQAILLSWLWRFGSSSVPIARVARNITLPLPTRITRQVPSSYLRLKIGSVGLDRSELDNPFISQSPLQANIMLPYGSEIKLSEQGILLKNTRWKWYANLKASVESRLCWKASPSELTKQWVLLANKPKADDTRRLSTPQKYLELGFAIKFAAVIGRLADDIHVKWASEMVEDLERYLDWDTFVDTMKQAQLLTFCLSHGSKGSG